MYGKFFASTFTGSMVGAGLNVFALWGYVIANTKQDGYVEINPTIVAATLGCELKEIESALAILTEPDPKSRNKKEEGRRLIQQSAFLYFVPTYADYRNIRNDETRRDYMKNYMREYRASKDVKVNVNLGKSRLAHTEAEAEAYAKKKIQNQEQPARHVDNFLKAKTLKS